MRLPRCPSQGPAAASVRRPWPGSTPPPRPSSRATTSATRRTPRACWRSSSSRARGSRSASTTRPGELEVVLHSSVAQLDAAQPWLPVARRLTAPAARRYVVGWAGPRELHVLAPRLLAHRASNVEGSLEMLMLAPSALLARRYVADGHPKLPPPLSPPRVARWSRWAWLVEGAAQWLSGQTRHVRPRSRAGCARARRPSFPPSRADALLLGGSVFDLLAREEGDRACVTLARGPHPDGPIRALEIAFPRSVRHTESAWRSHLERLAEV